ncbi:MAG: hypothetical protein ACPG49_06415 [Chitinophagales bacterium]
MATKKTEIYLLEHNPTKLISLYQPLLKKLIQAFLKHSSHLQNSPKILLQHLQNELPPLLHRLLNKHGEKTHFKTLIVEAARLLCNDFEDLQLLKQHSPQLAVKYAPIIINRVRSYVNTQNLKESEAEDVVQSVQEKLILKTQKGQLANFQGSALVRTFLFRVIENLIRDVLKSLRTQKVKVSSGGTELKAHHAIEDSVFQSLAGKIDLEKQANVLGYLLRLYKDIDRQKFELSSKVNYQIILGNKDLKQLTLPEDYKVELLVIFGKTYAHLSAQELWENLVIFTNQIEGKTNSSDAIWKWFSRHRNWMTVKILFAQKFQVQLRKKMTDAEKKLLAKISVRSFSKFVDDYFGEVIHAYYNK